MFRFSIRELSIAALTVALGIAWLTENKRLTASQSQCDGLRIRVEEAMHKAEDAKEGEQWIRDRREKDIELISQQLSHHDLQLIWFCGGNGQYPSISKRSAESSR